MSYNDSTLLKLCVLTTVKHWQIRFQTVNRKLHTTIQMLIHDVYNELFLATDLERKKIARQ